MVRRRSRWWWFCSPLSQVFLSQWLRHPSLPRSLSLSPPLSASLRLRPPSFLQSRSVWSNSVISQPPAPVSSDAPLLPPTYNITEPSPHTSTTRSPDLSVSPTNSSLPASLRSTHTHATNTSSYSSTTISTYYFCRASLSSRSCRSQRPHNTRAATPSSPALLTATAQ